MNWVSFIAYYLKPYKLRLFLLLLSTILLSSVFLCFGQALKYIIDKNLLKILYDYKNIALFVGFSILIAIIGFIQTYQVGWLTERIAYDIREHLAKHSIFLDTKLLGKKVQRDIVTSAINDTMLMQAILSNLFTTFFNYILIFIGSFIMIFFISKRFFLYSISLIPFMILPGIFLGKYIKEFSNNAQRNLSVLGRTISDFLDNIKSIHVFSMENIALKGFFEKNISCLEQSLGRCKYKAFFYGYILLFLCLFIGAILIYGFSEFKKGKLTSGELSSIFVYLVYASKSSTTLSNIFSEFKRLDGAIERISELFSINSFSKNAIFRQLPPPRGILAFNKVVFCSTNNSKLKTLNNLTFSTIPGENLSIIGGQNSGIPSILMRFCDIQSGNIYLDGIDLRQLRVSDVRTRISVLSNELNLIPGSLLDNLIPSQTSNQTRITKKDLEEVIQKTDLIEVIKKIGNLNAIIDPRILSKKEDISIKIARIMLRNSPLLFIEEAGIFSENEDWEEVLYENLKEFSENRTTITIATKLSTILGSDRILVINNGAAEAIGSHSELIHSCDFYKSFVSGKYYSEKDVWEKKIKAG